MGSQLVTQARDLATSQLQERIQQARSHTIGSFGAFEREALGEQKPAATVPPVTEDGCAKTFWL